MYHYCFQKKTLKYWCCFDIMLGLLRKNQNGVAIIKGAQFSKQKSSTHRAQSNRVHWKVRKHINVSRTLCLHF